MVPTLFVEREPDSRGLHYLTDAAGLSLCWMDAPAFALRFFRGWCDAGVELRLGRLLLAVSWDYDPMGPLRHEFYDLWDEYNDNEEDQPERRGPHTERKDPDHVDLERPVGPRTRKEHSRPEPEPRVRRYAPAERDDLKARLPDFEDAIRDGDALSRLSQQLRTRRLRGDTNELGAVDAALAAIDEFKKALDCETLSRQGAEYERDRALADLDEHKARLAAETKDHDRTLAELMKAREQRDRLGQAKEPMS